MLILYLFSYIKHGVLMTFDRGRRSSKRVSRVQEGDFLIDYCDLKIKKLIGQEMINKSGDFLHKTQIASK